VSFQVISRLRRSVLEARIVVVLVTKDEKMRIVAETLQPGRHRKHQYRRASSTWQARETTELREDLLARQRQSRWRRSAHTVGRGSSPSLSGAVRGGRPPNTSLASDALLLDDRKETTENMKSLIECSGAKTHSNFYPIGVPIRATFPSFNRGIESTRNSYGGW